ncbi:MAG: hypothetical protein HY834_00785 [Devosia nanyangense]|uniref:Calcium-binding protein n=1 Tax=Devosia nanyangense TaxID=1228055 RepID=A0A933KX62_9HYPH|nr:hypothetical protein [Devosia nanyangense]
MKGNFRLSTAALLAIILATAPAGALTLNLGGSGDGGLLGLGGNTDNDATVTIDAGDLLETGGILDTGLGGGTTTTVNASLGGGLGLFGGSNDPTTVNVNLGGTSGADADILLDLFGTGDDAKVTLGSGDVAGLDILGGDAGGSIILDLFGDPSGGGGTITGTDAFGDSGNNGGSGSSSGNGGIQVASLGPVDACFTPNAEQIAKLVNRHAYTAAAMSSWAQVRSLKVVEVGLCRSVRSRLEATLAADANIGRLQDYLAGNAMLRAGLRQQGHSAGDVIAVDKSGATLIVYVI